MNSHWLYNGSSLVVFFAAGILGVELLRLARNRLKEASARWNQIFRNTTPRFLVGGSIVCLSYALGNALYFPAFVLLEAGNNALLDKYARYVTIPSSINNVITVAGYALAMQPVLQRWFSNFWVASVISSAVFVWGVGSLATVYFAQFFVP